MYSNVVLHSLASQPVSGNSSLLSYDFWISHTTCNSEFPITSLTVLVLCIWMVTRTTHTKQAPQSEVHVSIRPQKLIGKLNTD